MKPVSPAADNPLGYQKESKLLINFAIPCIISMLVTALYNIAVSYTHLPTRSTAWDAATAT